MYCEKDHDIIKHSTTEPIGSVFFLPVFYYKIFLSDRSRYLLTIAILPGAQEQGPLFSAGLVAGLFSLYGFRVADRGWYPAFSGDLAFGESGQLGLFH